MIEIVVLFAGLSCAALHVGPESAHTIAAWTELVISATGFYLCSANFLNNFFKRVILPVGAPMGIIRGAAAH